MSANNSSASDEGVRMLDPRHYPDWDHQITRFDQADFFHTSHWAAVLSETYRYTPRYLAKFKGRKISAALPIMEVSSLVTGKRGISLPFTDCVPALCESRESYLDLYARALAEGKQRGWKYLECRGNRQWLPEAKTATCFYQHLLATVPDEKLLFKQFDESTRRSIRKAEKTELRVETSNSLKSVREFYALLCKTRRRHGVPPQPFRFFEAIQRHVLASGRGILVMAYLKGEPVAGVVFLFFGKRAIYKFGASDEAFQNLRGNNLVMWQAIRDCVARQIETIDFGRTSLPNEGLRKFKLGWATTERLIETTRLDLATGQYVAVKDDTKGWHTVLFSKLPLFVSRWAGSVLYRHIA